MGIPCLRCSQSIGNITEINATYLKTYYFNKDNNLYIIKSTAELKKILIDDELEKYDNNFFKNNSLIVINNIETSQGSRIGIESYRIENKTISISVKTMAIDDDSAMGYWWYILEIDTAKFNDIDYIKINKDEKEILSKEKENCIFDNMDISNNYYLSYSFDNVIKRPEFIDDSYNLLFKERRYLFVNDYLELQKIFENSLEEQIENYFKSDLFDNHVVLCIVRDETIGTAIINYSNFKVDGLQLSIDETITDGGDEVVSRYLDFVVISKALLPEDFMTNGIEYYWK